jgi:hypothetical protein
MMQDTRLSLYAAMSAPAVSTRSAASFAALQASSPPAFVVAPPVLVNFTVEEESDFTVSGGSRHQAFPSEVPTPGRTPHGFASIFFFDLDFSQNLSDRSIF